MQHLENYNVIGQNISELLYLQRKKQSWLAQKCGVTPSHINQIIKGKTKPSLALLIVIADELDVTIEDIINNNF